MASRKNLKKAVKNICSELFADCVALCLCNQPDTEKLKGIMADVMATYNDYVARISHVEPGVAPRAFFQKLRKDFSEKAEALSEAIIQA